MIRQSMSSTEPSPGASVSVRRPFEPHSFSRQFLVVSAVLLVAAMLIVGFWLDRQIKTSAINRTAAIAAVYTESIVAAELGRFMPTNRLADPGSDIHTGLDRLFLHGPLQRKVVRFKLWSRDGTILYSSDHAQQGLHFPVEGALAEALQGRLQARLSQLQAADNVPERDRWPQLLEVYVPLKLDSSNEVQLVAEFYHATDNLFRDIEHAQQRSWALLAVATIVIYLFLRGLVRRANDTILDQRRDLQAQLGQLRAALDENQRMREQLRQAGARTTALNESLLHRIAADLHDGPAQQIAFALMRFDDSSDSHNNGTADTNGQDGDRARVLNALRSALTDLRNIAAGLGLPGVENLSLTDTIRRAVRDFERLSGVAVSANIAPVLDEASGSGMLALKITAYRLIQEALNNSARHAPGTCPSVTALRTQDELQLEISDHGPGFDPSLLIDSDRLGLAFLRERVRLLGGVFEVDSAHDSGTTVRARLPLNAQSATHA